MYHVLYHTHSYTTYTDTTHHLDTMYTILTYIDIHIPHANIQMLHTAYTQLYHISHIPHTDIHTKHTHLHSHTHTHTYPPSVHTHRDTHTLTNCYMQLHINKERERTKKYIYPQK